MEVITCVATRVTTHKRAPLASAAAGGHFVSACYNTVIIITCYNTVIIITCYITVITPVKVITRDSNPGQISQSRDFGIDIFLIPGFKIFPISGSRDFSGLYLAAKFT